MTTISQYIMGLLQDDILSHGLLVQCVEQGERGDKATMSALKDVLAELLSDEVEIGSAKSTANDYVEFIAWKGNVSERIDRAIECVDKAVGPDKEFAYWLCLRKNIDRYE